MGNGTMTTVKVRTARPHFCAQQYFDNDSKIVDVTEEQLAELHADREMFVEAPTKEELAELLPDDATADAGGAPKGKKTKSKDE